MVYERLLITNTFGYGYKYLKFRAIDGIFEISHISHTGTDFVEGSIKVKYNMDKLDKLKKIFDNYGGVNFIIGNYELSVILNFFKTIIETI